MRSLPRAHRKGSVSSFDGDLRSPFQRDRDRVLYSAHFRRLSGVTQVTSPLELHTFHNRLTHTLEVAQIARRISERLLLESPELVDQINPDVCESAALIHDLGHPPFGHNGEKSLDAIARRLDKSSDGYEGNAQSFRIVTKLAVQEPVDLGLDLTAATLRASIKYPKLRDFGRDGQYIENSKFGIYQTENAEFERIFEGYDKGVPTLEASIMDWADDVAYSTHDFYDFVLAGLIPLHHLEQLDGLGLRQLLSGNVKLKNVSDDAFENVAFRTRALPPYSLGTASRFSSQIVSDMKSWVSAGISRYTTQELTLVDGCICIPQDIRDEVEILKALTFHFAIGSPALALRQVGEYAIIKGLAKVLWADVRGKQRMISDEAKGRLDKEQNAIRVVLDTISSMTDAQAVSMFQKSHGIQLASILDVTTTSTL